MRTCAYEKCNKTLPSTFTTKQKYCKGTDCYYKQNQLDAKKKRAATIKKYKQLTCLNDYCENTFDQKKSTQKYCCTECRRQQSQFTALKKKNKEVSLYLKTKEIAKSTNGNKKNIILKPEWLTRGRIHYEGHRL